MEEFKLNLLNLDEKEITEYILSLGMKKFYGKQIFNWLHGKLIRNINDMSNISLKDREMLSDNGIMIISVTLNKQTKEIISGPEVLTRGFVYVRDSYELINEIKKISEDIIIKNTKSVKYIEYNKVKNIIRDELSKYLIKETGNKPMIITVMQEI